MARPFNLQDGFLNQARREEVPVTIYLVNGVQVRGVVRGFDNFTVLVEGEGGRQMLIYKHALSTVVPASPLSVAAARREAAAAGEAGGAQPA